MSDSRCCSNPPTLNPNSGSGLIDNLGGIDSYVSSSPNFNFAIVLASDIFGYEAPNLRKLADKIAASGFFVVVPDLLHGDPFVPGDSKRPLQLWDKDHPPEKGFEDAKVVIEALKSKGFSAIGAAGFCWGAKAVVELSKVKLIDAAALLHPNFVTVDDIKEVKSPIAVLGAELDKFCPPKLVKEFDEILKGKPEIESFVKIYPGVEHGWTLRYDVEDEVACRRAEEAHDDLIRWFTVHEKRLISPSKSIVSLNFPKRTKL